MNRFATLAAAAALVLAPTAALAESDSGRLSAELNIPHMCEIGGNYHMDLTGDVSPGQNNVRRADADALYVSQNGATLWTLTELDQRQLPHDSILNWGSGIAVDFQNRGLAPGNITLPNDTLRANVADNGPRSIEYQGAFSGEVTVLANIDEDASFLNPITNTLTPAPLLGGERYLITTRFRCTALQFNDR